MADRAGGIKAGKSRRRVGVMKSLRIYSIAGGMKPSRARRQRLAGEAPHLLDGVFHLGFLLNFAHYLNVRLIGDRRTDKFANQARPVCYQHSDGIHSPPHTNQTTEAKYGHVAISEAGSIKTQAPIQDLRHSELGE
jgi:hypothetical protein